MSSVSGLPVHGLNRLAAWCPQPLPARWRLSTEVRGTSRAPTPPPPTHPAVFVMSSGARNSDTWVLLAASLDQDTLPEKSTGLRLKWTLFWIGNLWREG